MYALRYAILLNVALSCTVQAQDADPPPLKNLLPRLKPTEPADALGTFRLEPGFRLELVAAEPDVFDPIALAFDAAGRMYVCEDRDYPYGAEPGTPPLGQVRLLEDRDGDGRYERSSVFARHVHWASGVACWKGGVLVAAPPQILYLKDTDGDGRADVRRVVFDGFGTRTAEDIMNNLKWGLDHRIYGAASYNGGEVRRPGADARTVAVRGSSFRFDPTAHKFERLAGTGDFGNCFDDWGNRFVCNAGNLLMHPVLADPYVDRNPHLAVGQVLHYAASAKRDMYSISPPEPWRVVRKRFWSRWVDTTPDMRASRFSDAELAERGFVTGGAGGAIYRGDVYPAKYQGNSFTAEPAGNVVIRLEVNPQGVTFNASPTTKDREFLASSDNWFRPVNVVNGPDGCLYVCDMYREIIEDPSAIPDDILKLVDVTGGRDRGRIWRIVPEGFRRPAGRDFNKATTAELVAALEDPQGWARQTAQRLLFERQDRSAVEPLRHVAAKSDNPKARLHALYALDGLAACDEALLIAALGDAHPAVREHAVRLAEPKINASSELAAKICSLADDEGARVRFQVAFTLGQLHDRRAAIEALAKIAGWDAADRWIPTAILSSVPRDGGVLLAKLLDDEPFARSGGGRALIGRLLEMIGSRGDAEEVAAVLTVCLAKQASEAARWIARLAAGLQRAGGSLSAYLHNQPEATQDQFQALLHRAAANCADEQQPLAERLHSIELLRHGSWDTAAASLAPLLSARQSAELQLAAIRALSAFDEPGVATRLVAAWGELTPSVRREAAEALLGRTQRVGVLLQALAEGKISTADLDPARRQALLEHGDRKVRQLARKVLNAAAGPQRSDVIRRYQASLSLPGDARRGAAVFKANCATCHALDNVGKNVGPDLKTIANRSPEQLLEQILDPNREVKPQYQNYLAITEDGRSFSGIIAEESAASITLRRAEGAEDILLRSRLEQFRSTGISLMPEGLEKNLTGQQMADLLDYLRPH